MMKMARSIETQKDVSNDIFITLISASEVKLF